MQMTTPADFRVPAIRTTVRKLRRPPLIAKQIQGA